MLSKGCPLVGDKVYAKGRNLQRYTKQKVIDSIENLNRHALHAIKITFYHPMDNRLLEFSAAKPKDFLKLEKVLFED